MRQDCIGSNETKAGEKRNIYITRINYDEIAPRPGPSARTGRPYVSYFTDGDGEQQVQEDIDKMREACDAFCVSHRIDWSDEEPIGGWYSICIAFPEHRADDHEGRFLTNKNVRRILMKQIPLFSGSYQIRIRGTCPLENHDFLFRFLFDYAKRNQKPWAQVLGEQWDSFERECAENPQNRMFSFTL